ncbi:restriction endonuclease subunit S [Prevotella koreensis]
MEPKIRFTNIIGPWSVKTIGEMYKFKNGLNKGKGSFGFGTPIINYTDVYKHRGLTREMVKGLVKLDANEIRRYKVKKGDVFFTRTSETPEEVGLASVLLEDIDDCSFSGFVLRGRPITDDLEFDYCKECFSVHAVRDSIIKTCTYTTRALTNGTVLSKIPITIPPKEEQKTIASYFSSLDSLIYSTSKKIESLKHVKAASLQSMFPREGETTPRVRFKGFEGEWKSVTLGEIAEMQSGGTPSSHNSEYYNGNIPFLSITDMTNAGKYINSTIKSITEYGLANSSARIYPAGTLMYAMYASLGKCSITNIDVAISQAILGFSLSNEIDREFLYQYLCNIESSIKCLGQTGTQTNLSKSIVEKFNILIPTLSEQKLVGNLLSSLDSQISLQTQRLEKLKQIKSACLDNMFV